MATFLSELNNLLRPSIKIKDLSPAKPYKIEEIQRSNSQFSEAIVIFLKDSGCLYLPKAAAQGLISNPGSLEEMKRFAKENRLELIIKGRDPCFCIRD